MSESAGERLRAAILDTYALDTGELVLLDQAVEVCDVLDRVNRDVAALEVLTSTGSAHQKVEHPLLKTQRDYSALLARMVEALRLPAPGDEEGENVTTLRARRAADARWQKEKEHG